jgi:tRNA pseudouridine55 synthase
MSVKPLIFNCFKPARKSSYDIIRLFKKNIPKKELGKIGHFGTLDPFACGVLLIGIGGAQKLNNFIHDDLPKTYLGVGKLGVDYDTGDMTGELQQSDETDFFKQEIKSFSKEFIEKQLQEKFLGTYMQAPHKFSAAKHEGKKLYEYARDGVEIKKEKKERTIYSLEVVKYEHPYLSIRFKVSSGTYIRTLFSDCARYLGTLGTLVSLVRESIGELNIENSLKMSELPKDNEFNLIKNGLTPDQVYPLEKIILNEKHSALFSNGVQLRVDQIEMGEESKRYWIYSQDDLLLGMGEIKEGKLITQFNFSANS